MMEAIVGFLVPLACGPPSAGNPIYKDFGIYNDFGGGRAFMPTENGPHASAPAARLWRGLTATKT